jgi:hypothetical protein
MNFDISKKQFNARLTFFNVSLIFICFATKSRSHEEKEVTKGLNNYDKFVT